MPDEELDEARRGPFVRALERRPGANRRIARGFSGTPAPPIYLANWHDLTFVRASEAAYADPRRGWAFEASGAAAWKASNEPRIFTDGAILIEGARTNTLLGSRDPTNGTHWSNGEFGTYTGTADDAAGPDGATEADRLEVSGTSFSKGQTTSGMANPHVISMYGRAKSGTSRWVPNYSAGAAWDVTLGEDFERKTKKTANTGSVFYPCDSSLASGAAQDVLVDLAQAEDGAFASSPIRTAGATATRALDDASIAVGTNAFSSAFFTDGFEIDVWPEFSSADSALAILFVDSVGTYYLRFAAGGVLNFNAGGTQVVTGAVTWSALDRLTIRVSYGDTVKTSVNGTQQDSTSIASLGSWSARSGNAWEIGHFGGASQVFFGVISRPRAL